MAVRNTATGPSKKITAAIHGAKAREKGTTKDVPKLKPLGAFVLPE